MYFNPLSGVALVTVDVEEATPMKRVVTPCGVTLSPVSPAQVIVGGIVFDAVHARLPDGLHVVAVKDAAGAFPDTVMDLLVRIIFDPYQESDEPWVLDTHLVAWSGGNPIRGELTPDDVDAFEDEGDEDWGPDDDDDGGEDWTPDGDEDEDDGEELGLYPMPRRFIYDELVKPSVN